MAAVVKKDGNPLNAAVVVYIWMGTHRWRRWFINGWIEEGWIQVLGWSGYIPYLKGEYLTITIANYNTHYKQLQI